MLNWINLKKKEKMKRFFFMIMVTTVGAIAPVGTYAQKVYKSGSQVILDLTTVAGMPADAVTTVSKTEIYKDFTPSETALGTDNNHNGSINEKVFQKLEVAKHDLTGSGTTGSAGGRFTWVKAFNYCRAIAGGEWRLPTQREQMLMYIFRPALDDILLEVSGGALLSSTYWTSTEVSTDGAWTVSFMGGRTPSTTGKDNSLYARCVREVVD
jgi:hypothetical protein